MGFFDWIMKGIGFESEEDEDDFETPQVKTERKSRRERKIEKRLEKGAHKIEKKPIYDEFETPMFSSNASFGETASSPQFSNHSFGEGLTNSVGGYGSKNFVFFTPKNYDDVKSLVDFLRQGEPAIINLDEVSDKDAQRTLDFISGAVCALSASIQRISGNIFLIAPEGFNIMKSK